MADVDEAKSWTEVVSEVPDKQDQGESVRMGSCQTI
jgi:hypothetical protein